MKIFAPGFALLMAITTMVSAAARSETMPLYIYTLAQDGTPASYDESLAVACLQGIINRESPQVYVVSKTNHRPQYWLDLLSKDGRWLHERKRESVADIKELVKLAGPKLKGAVIWDAKVPASINVATTIAGVEDLVALSPELADRYIAKLGLKVIHDLRGKFASKNEAYRWAIDQYLARGLCSSHLLCLFEDAYSTRAKGDIGYVLTRDWAVKNRAFVFDLSPWGDEPPQDDPHQKLGLDLETYHMILAETMKQAAGKHMTELTGFFAFSKYSNMPDHPSKHEGVPTEWESVWLMSPYNCYQNTISSECFNQSVHSQAPRGLLKQGRAVRDVPLENKTYLCVLMADYDSATPLYDFMPKNWDDRGRGKIPLMWGINPNLLETYPDIIAYLYETATPMDTFASDASAAGYMNPNRIEPKFMPLFVEHNRKFFREADMTIAPMVLDQDEPSPRVKDAFVQFAPNGLATIVQDEHHQGGKFPQPHVWKGMPVMELINEACNSGATSSEIADAFDRAISHRGSKQPGFYLFRVVWSQPSKVVDAISILGQKRSDLNVELLDPKTFFDLFKSAHSKTGP